MTKNEVIWNGAPTLAWPDPTADNVSWEQALNGRKYDDLTAEEQVKVRAEAIRLKSELRSR